MTEKGFHTPFEELLEEVDKQSSDPKETSKPSLDEGIEPPTQKLTVSRSTPELI